MARKSRKVYEFRNNPKASSRREGTHAKPPCRRDVYLLRDQQFCLPKPGHQTRVPSTYHGRGRKR